MLLRTNNIISNLKSIIMKTRLLSLAAFAFAITSSFGQLVFHEPFNYTDSGTNDQLIGQG